MEISFFNKKIKLPKYLYWREILAVLFLMIGIYFFHKERREVANIIPFLHTANKSWLLVATLITFVFVLFQSLMYVSSFRAINQKLSLKLCIELFLKRSFLSVFLPGGGVSALAYIPKSVKHQIKDKLIIYQASGLFGFAGVLSTFIISIVVVVTSFNQNKNQNETTMGLLLLALFIFALFYLMYAVRKETKLFRWVQQKYPKAATRVKEIGGADVNAKQYIYTIVSSLGVEFCGIAHLYVAMLAVHAHPSLQAAGLAYVVSVLLMVASPFLRGVGAVELSVTFVLQTYGYTAVEALAITLVYRAFEFWLPLLLGLISFVQKGRHLFLRLFPAFFIFLMGIINILSVLTPPLADRIKLVQHFLPQNTIRATNTLVIYFGVTLLVTAAYMVRGLRNAWWIAFVCTLLSLAGHIFKGLDWEEATIAFVVLLSLYFTRKQYNARTDPRLVNRATITSVIVFFALLVYGFVGFYFLEKRHFNIDFDRYESLKNTVLIFLLQKINLEPLTPFGSQFLVSMYVLATAAWVFLLYAFVRPYVSITQLHKEQARAVQILEKWGDSAVDFFKVSDDKLFCFSKNFDGFIAYRIERGYAIVLELPVCAPENKIALLNEFTEYCKKKGLKTAYYRVDESMLPDFFAMNKKCLLIGQEAIADITSFELTGRDKKSLRNGLNSLQKKGYVTSVYTPPHNAEFLQSLKAISDEWLQTYKREEMIFSQGKWDEKTLQHQDIIATINSENKPVAFLNVIPDYVPGECTYDLIRKTADAPGGCMDALIIELIKYAKENGKTTLNLGLAPMSGLEAANTTIEQVMKYAYKKIKRFRHYHGLRSFKEKYASHWVNKYLVYDTDFDLLQLPAALNKAMKPLYDE